MKPKYLICLVLFSLFLFVITPATAYDMYWEKNWNNTGSGAKELNAIQVKLLENFCDVTLLTLDGNFYSQNSGDGSHSGNLLYGGTTHGTYTANWYATNAVDYNSPGQLQITVDSCNLTGHSGGGYLMLDGLAAWGTHYLAFFKDNYYYNTESNNHTAYPGCYEQAYAPTATTTRTFYGDPVSFSNITVNVKNLAGTNLEGITVHVLTDVYDYSGTTVAGGNITLNVGYNSVNAELYTDQTGYYLGYSEFFQITGAEMTKFIYLNQNTGGAPEYNITYHVTNNAGADLPDAFVVHTFSPLSSVDGYTDGNGEILFQQVPSISGWVYVEITKTGYQNYNSFFAFTGDMTKNITLYPIGATPTPTATLTPVITTQITLNAYPSSVGPGDPVSLVMSCSGQNCTGAQGMHVVTYSENVPNSWNTYPIAIYHYNTSSGGWDYRPDSGSSWSLGTYSPFSATATPTISGTYTYYVNVVKDNYYSIGQAQANVLVSGTVSGNLNMLLAAQDQTTGGHLSNYQMNLTNDATGGITEYGTVPYQQYALLPRGLDFTVQCSKTGYLDGEYSFTVPTNPDIEDGDMGTFINCPLYPTGSISSGNTTVTVKVFDSENSMPLPNVQVQMTAPIIYSDSPKYTGGEGSGVFFILGQNQDYYVTASKTGYCAVTETGSTGTDATQNKYIWLKYGTCLGPTPTHTSIPSLTPTPSIIVTPTSFQPGNATSFWAPWINVFTMMGANMGEINMLLAALIIILCMAAGAGMAGVLGAEVCMGFGAIFCVAIGLIPIWVVLAIIILGFLFYGLKIGR